MIQGLPPGKIDYIYMFIKSDEMGGSDKTLLFSHLNRNIVLNNRINRNMDNLVRLYCTSNGIVEKLEHNIGEFTFRQETRANFSNII